MYKPILASLALAMAAPFWASAATPADIDGLRQELDALRTEYEARLRTLEQRLKAAEDASSVAPSAPLAAPPSTPAATPAGANAFNPSVSLILSGLYTRTSRDPATYSLAGVSLPVSTEVGPGSRGLSLAETELTLAANIDPWWRGSASIALQRDNTVSVEEAFVQTSALGTGLALKAGRFFSGVGYLNSQHPHVWDFVDNPLAYQAFLGTQYGDDGLQLTWLAPIDQYLALGFEIGRGRSFPGADNSRNGAGMTALTAHTGGDIGESQNWRAGLSMLNAKADDQALIGQGGANGAFSGSTRVLIADAVWKWAPNGNATRTNVKLQGEYLRSTRSGSLAADSDQSVAGYRTVQSGWYLQAIYQFMPRWRVGLRTERLDPGTNDFARDAGLGPAGDYRPRKDSLLLDFNASEFSRLRLQVAQDRSRPGSADRQLLLQYQMSLGAHGAHSY
ncbi:MAG: hypothetical protein ABIP08_05635 [Lautropia sp.]